MYLVFIYCLCIWYLFIVFSIYLFGIYLLYLVFIYLVSIYLLFQVSVLSIYIFIYCLFISSLSVSDGCPDAEMSFIFTRSSFSQELITPAGASHEQKQSSSEPPNSARSIGSTPDVQTADSNQLLGVHLLPSPALWMFNQRDERLHAVGGQIS